MNALVPVNTAPAMTVSDVEKVASAIAKGGLFGSKDPYAVLTLCLLAQAEGQHPAVVFRDYHIISGKPAKKAEAMLRDFINAGGKIEWHALTDELADATFSHPSGGTARISWDHARAVKAQIAGNAMYKKYPRQMLRSRAISEGVRTIYPGATSGLYVPEETSTFDPPVEDQTHEAANDATDELTDAQRRPAPREKLDGPHTSATALKKAVDEIITKVRAAESEETLEAIKHDHKRTINQALRDYPALINGDPEIAECVGLRGFIEMRRAALQDRGQFDLLIDSMKSCSSLSSYTNWRATNEAIIDELDDLQRREFERAADEFEAGLSAVAAVNAG